MRKVEFTARPVSCSVNPLTFDRELCIGCGQDVYKRQHVYGASLRLPPL